MEFFSCFMSIHSHSCCSSLFVALGIFIMFYSVFIMVVLDMKMALRSSLNGFLDVYEHLINILDVKDVPRGIGCTGWNDVNNPYSTNGKQIFLNNDPKRDTNVEDNHHNDTWDVVCPVHAAELSFLLDGNILMEYDRNWIFTFKLNCTLTIHSILYPSTNIGFFSIGNERSFSFSNVIYKFTIVTVTIICCEFSFTPSYIIFPSSFVMWSISPLAVTKTVSLTITIFSTLILTRINSCEGMGGNSLLISSGNYLLICHCWSHALNHIAICIHHHCWGHSLDWNISNLLLLGCSHFLCVGHKLWSI